MDHNPGILLIDADEQSALEILRFLKVSTFTFSVSHASDIREGINYLKNRKPDIVLVDSAIATARDFENFKSQFLANQKIPFILLSAFNDADAQTQANELGASDYLVKNKINLFHLQKTILGLLKVNEAENKSDTDTLELKNRNTELLKLLDKSGAGILLVDKANQVLFANTGAHIIMGNEATRRAIKGYLNYQEITGQLELELRPEKEDVLTIRVSNTRWNDEPATLFLIEKQKPVERQGLNHLSGSAFSALLNGLNEAVMLLNDGVIVFANEHSRKQFGLDKTEPTALKLSDLFQLQEAESLKTTITDFFAPQQQKAIFTLPNGAQQSVKLLVKPMNLNAEFYQIVTVQFQQDLSQAVPKSPANSPGLSVEGIMQLASHDLREPVRTILNYVQLISDNLAQKKYESASEYAGFAKSAADGMEKLLSDLKTYISLNEYKFELNKVSMKLALGDVLKQLKGKIAETGTEINSAELPEIKADRELVERLIYHLVDNAIKFHKKDKKPVIDIGYDKYEGNILFCVRDNGIGISKKYHQKIFESFERLNRVDEYPGNGLGLAICKKIVEMHGGKIWVESLPGLGSSFYFTLSPT